MNLLMKALVDLRRRVREWYVGEPWENEPGDPIVVIGMKRPKWAWRLDDIGRFIRKNWKWLISIAVAIGVGASF